MIFSLFGKNKANGIITARQYEALTDAARHVSFYQDMNVPDTVMGRFEMLSIHMVLYLRRTKDESDASSGLAQSIVDAFFEDIDHSMRELGIGDASVPKRMKKFARMFYGRAESYGQALDDADLEQLKQALMRNIFPEPEDDTPSMSQLAQFILNADQQLKLISEEQLSSGNLRFPSPQSDEN